MISDNEIDTLGRPYGDNYGDIASDVEGIDFSLVPDVVRNIGRVIVGSSERPMGYVKDTMGVVRRANIIWRGNRGRRED